MPSLALLALVCAVLFLGTLLIFPEHRRPLLRWMAETPLGRVAALALLSLVPPAAALAQAAVASAAVD